MQNVPEVIQHIPLTHYLLLACALFCTGLLGVLIRRNMLILFMSVELMLNAVNLMLTSFASFRADSSGQVFVFFIMAVAAAEVAVGLGIIVMIYRNMKTTNINLLNKLKW